jgi:hypothetical protein
MPAFLALLPTSRFSSVYRGSCSRGAEPSRLLTRALANGFANERGRARTDLTDALDARVVSSLFRSTATDGSGTPGRFEEPYGSEGWGFESLRAR